MGLAGSLFGGGFVDGDYRLGSSVHWTATQRRAYELGGCDILRLPCLGCLARTTPAWLVSGRDARPWDAGPEDLIDRTHGLRSCYSSSWVRKTLLRLDWSHERRKTTACWDSNQYTSGWSAWTTGCPIATRSKADPELESNRDTSWCAVTVRSGPVYLEPDPRRRVRGGPVQPALVMGQDIGRRRT